MSHWGISGRVRAEKLMDPDSAEAGGGSDLTDGLPRRKGFDDGPDPLAPAFFRTLRGETEPGAGLRFAPKSTASSGAPSRLSLSARLGTRLVPRKSTLGCAL